MPTPESADAITQLRGIDIYLFDQLARGRITPDMRVLEVGCGGGRNLAYLLRAGAEVYGIDADPAAIEQVRALAAGLAPGYPPDRFRVAPMQAPGFPPGSFDAVLAIAVLHFARDDAEFAAMLAGAWALVRPGGLLFCRLASTIGMEGQARPLGGRRFVQPDGTERYLVDEPLLLARGRELGGVPADPIKTTVVQAQRAMTTWVLRKEKPDAPYRADTEVAALVEGFRDQSLSRAAWTHRAHLTVGLWHARRWPWAHSLHRMREGIQRLNAALGIVSTPTDGYHETVTVLYMRLIAAYAGAHPAALLTAADANRLFDVLGDRDLPLRYYSPERLWSPEARARWIEPDRASVPKPSGER